MVGLMLNNGVHLQSRTDIFFIYTILTFSLAAAHVDGVAQFKAPWLMALFNIKVHPVLVLALKRFVEFWVFSPHCSRPVRNFAEALK